MVEDKWAATGGGAVREEGFTNMVDDSILLWDEVRQIVLNMRREVEDCGEKRIRVVVVDCERDLGFLSVTPFTSS